MGTHNMHDGEPKPADWLVYVCAVCGGVGRFQGRECGGCLGRLTMRLPLRVRSELWCNVCDRDYVPLLMAEYERNQARLLERGKPMARHVMGTRDKHPVSFTCEYCGYEKTEMHGPGQLPHYCQACYVEAQRHLNRMRVKAHRERQKAAVAPPSAPGSIERPLR